MKLKSIKWLNDKITDKTTKSELDIIDYIKLCIRNYKTEIDESKIKVDWKPFFEKLWKMYPKHVSKQTACKTFEHKIRGLSEDECREKCNLIYKAQYIRQKEWADENRDIQYIPHYSSFLNSEIPNSKFYKGK